MTICACMHVCVSSINYISEISVIPLYHICPLSKWVCLKQSLKWTPVVFMWCTTGGPYCGLFFHLHYYHIVDIHCNIDIAAYKLNPNHRQLDCLFNHLFGLSVHKISKLSLLSFAIMMVAGDLTPNGRRTISNHHAVSSATANYVFSIGPILARFWRIKAYNGVIYFQKDTLWLCMSWGPIMYGVYGRSCGMIFFKMNVYMFMHKVKHDS